MKVEFFKHNIKEEDINEAVDTLRSLFITSGTKTALLEKMLAEYTDNQFSAGLTSCTAGLFLILKALNFPENSEIITPALSFAASANTVIHAGHIPVFCDVEPLTGNLDIDKIEPLITEKTKAIVAVHLYGQMCDMKKLKNLADKFQLKIIEDSAHCVEGSRDGIKPGNFSQAAAFSFYATKNITCGEGGAVTTNDRELNETIKVLRLHGLSRDAHNRYHSETFKQYDMEYPGYKYNMFDIQAALLIHQMKRIDNALKRREEIWKIYDDAFRPYLQTPSICDNSRHARHLYTIWVDKNKRNSIIDQLFKKEISVSVHFLPIPYLSYYKNRFGFAQGQFPVSEDIGAKTITLPFYPDLTDSEINYVIENVLALVK